MIIINLLCPLLDKGIARTKQSALIATLGRRLRYTQRLRNEYITVSNLQLITHQSPKGGSTVESSTYQQNPKGEVTPFAESAMETEPSDPIRVSGRLSLRHRSLDIKSFINHIKLFDRTVSINNAANDVLRRRDISFASFTHIREFKFKEISDGLHRDWQGLSPHALALRNLDAVTVSTESNKVYRIGPQSVEDRSRGVE
ncbi:hypothetical protein EVAR_97965_1 [Eumeta japonica]|uniref:Uncharacterized protein n=1 Tax=Eumeta variegata TaxID=151549 RepID=A0A4C1XDE9_EUMVA|nr:hypothetical protein EVAR_97965_1 [Eumeta japonica]